MRNPNKVFGACEKISRCLQKWTSSGEQNNRQKNSEKFSENINDGQAHPKSYSHPKINILDFESSNALIFSSSAMIVMHVKFLKQSNKSICTNLSSLMGIRGSSDKCLIIAEFLSILHIIKGKKLKFT